MYEKSSPSFMCPYKRCKNFSIFFSFSGTEQPAGGEEAYKTFRDTTTSTVKCRHTHRHMDM